MFMTLLFFAIWSRLVISASIIQQPDSEEFWISANLLSVEWELACHTITYCDQPELKMIKTNSINGEKNSFSWQLDQNFEQVVRILH